jgi:hypothetical protein
MRKKKRKKKIYLLKAKGRAIVISAKSIEMAIKLIKKTNYEGYLEIYEGRFSPNPSIIQKRLIKEIRIIDAKNLQKNRFIETKSLKQI